MGIDTEQQLRMSHARQGDIDSKDGSNKGFIQNVNALCGRANGVVHTPSFACGSDS
jgi:hypothetical protein